jgi:hypothetical protein
MDVDWRFYDIANSLVDLGFSDPHTKYVVYYDGPGHPDICGEGGNHSDGFGYAIAYVQACAGVPLSTTATHELLHTLGAVPGGAPNECAAPHDGHVCDDAYDIMFPFGDETPITGCISIRDATTTTRTQAASSTYRTHPGSFNSIDRSRSRSRSPALDP